MPLNDEEWDRRLRDQGHILLERLACVRQTIQSLIQQRQQFTQHHQ